MLSIIFAVIAIVCLAGSYTNFVRARKNAEDAQKIIDMIQENDGLTEWAKDAVIVVRSKDDHTDVMRTTVAALYGNHRDGREFRQATMLFQNQGFKVYAQSKPRA
jgi:hypothetical protein